MKILLISDIHGNYPALEGIEKQFILDEFDTIINCGDSLVYCPFPNETLQWLQRNSVISILGNTDKKVIKLLTGKSFNKPSNPEKRVMYTSCAEQLTAENSQILCSLPKKAEMALPWSPSSKGHPNQSIGIFHGSPEHPHAFLFNSTPLDDFEELAVQYPHRLIVTGHSHTPYHVAAHSTHFINPGSIGRMFDGSPHASCATVELTESAIRVNHIRISYDIEKVASRLRNFNLPPIYEEMFRKGRKLN